jgi:hypothetical protein
MTETPIQRAVRERDEALARMERDHKILCWVGVVVWAMVLVVALTGCTASPVYPVTPPAPVDPVRPAPVDPAPVVDEIKDPVPHATAVQAASGMTLDELTTLLGRQPHASAQRDDGTVGALWATTDSTGRKAWLNVILVAGKSEKPVLIPRGPK